MLGGEEDGGKPRDSGHASAKRWHRARDMIELDRLQSLAVKDYQNGNPVLSGIEAIAEHCTGLLSRTVTEPLGRCDGKDYHVLRVDSQISRPVHLAQFVRSSEELLSRWEVLRNSASPEEGRYDSSPEDINKVLYSICMGFAVCYDLWRPSSRKTPGTFFEVVVGSLVQVVLPDMARVAHVSLPEHNEKVSTDIAFLEPEGVGGLVLPIKITTRERIVQPFAHQRILDSVFGESRFQSVLVCVSEMQRQGTTGAKAVCVPGTIRLFQRHLAALSGLYYLDPPLRYLEPDVVECVPVRTAGDLLRYDLPYLVRS